MPSLCDPIEINGMKVPNSFVRSATNDRRAALSGPLMGFYERLASGGIGLIVTGHAFVTGHGKANPTMLGVHMTICYPC